MITATLRGKTYTFATHPGLFSPRQIDPGTAFLVEKMAIQKSDTVLDLGCGYGVIGLVAASLASQGEVYLVDTDIRAIACTAKNATLNKLTNTHVIPSDGYSKLQEILFNVILSNPPSHLPKDIRLQFIQGAKTHLFTDGKLLFVTEKRLATSIQRDFQRHFGNYEQLATNGKYIISQAAL